MNPSSPPMPPVTPGRPWPVPIAPVNPAEPVRHVSPVTPVAAVVPPPAEVDAEVDAEVGVDTAAVENGMPVVTGDAPRSHRRDKVLYVRVNLNEKEQIVAQAHECRLSISRYLTRLALAKRPPPTEVDRQRVEKLLVLFKRMEVNVRRLHAEASRMRLFSVVPSIEEDFDATQETVRGLIRELGKRL